MTKLTPLLFCTISRLIEARDAGNPVTLTHEQVVALDAHISGLVTRLLPPHPRPFVLNPGN